MSPASRSKSKEKSARAAKEQQKASSKPTSAPANAGSSIPASAYNPISGTFHTLETAPTASSPPPHNNGRFRTFDDTDEHSGSSNGTGPEYDSVSNNDSCSGESEDQKEKAASLASRPEAIPGSDNDKRDKIRQKNEKKHQRQREKRAQELHERCSGYLMSRKLEALAQQLVAMGFPSERATMALIHNEGRVEESVAWLFEGGEDGQQMVANIDRGRLKINIAEELAHITEMEIKCKCTKQEVERAIVACEGDLEKANETLRVQKEEPAAAPRKPEGTGDPPAVNGGKQLAFATQVPIKTQAKTVASVTIQQRRDERDFNYTKAAVPVAAASPEAGIRNLQSLRRIQSRPQVVGSSDKKWPSMSSSPVSYSLASPLQTSPPPSKTDARFVVVGSEVKNLQSGTFSEPVIMMQRPQSINSKQNPAVSSLSSSLPVTAGWYSNGVASVELTNGGYGHIPGVSLSTSSPSSQQFYHQQQYQPINSSSVDSAAAGWGGSWNATGTSSLTTPSSLGLFTGWGSTGSSSPSSPVDWSMGGSMPQFDYTSIDWSMESTSSRQNGLLLGLESYLKNRQMYDGWSLGTAMGTKAARPGVNGIYIAGLQEGGRVATDASSAGSHEWTSPFAGKDLFSLPRQSVSSPSL